MNSQTRNSVPDPIMPVPVWISGMGVVSAAGAGIEETAQSFRTGAVRASTEIPFETRVKCPAFIVPGELPNLPGRYQSSRTLRLAMKAVHEALRHAKLDAFPAGIRVGVCLGTTVGCQLNCIPFYAAYLRGENPSLEPIYDYLETNLAQSVAELLEVSGPRLTVVNACSSGTDALGIAANWIRAGLCDIAIAGGADELHPVPFSGFWSLGVMSQQLCKPFDRNRAGLNLGEGAGIMILESDVSAKTCGKNNSYLLAGYGSACDAHHLTAPHPQGRGLRAAIAAALAQGGVNAKCVAFINAHGTATADNDSVEGKVLADCFGTDAIMLSTKGLTGHTLGAAGGIEAVFTLLGLQEGWVPASAGFQTADPEIPIRPVSTRTEIHGEFALSTSLAFGGNNAAVLIRRIA